MKRRRIIVLSLLSVPVALAAVYGLIPTAAVEAVVWLLVGLGIAWMLRSVPKPFASGLACGLLLATWQHVLNIALWATYAAHNPELAKQMLDAAAEKHIDIT